MEGAHDWQGAEPSQDAHALAETIAALRSELQERAGAEAHVRGALAGAQAELEARVATQTRLEATLGDLRRELNELRELVEHEASQRAEVESHASGLAAQLGELQELQARQREQLASSLVARDAAMSEAAGLRAELEALGNELASARVHAESRSGGLQEAEALLAQARELTSRMREPERWTSAPEQAE